MARTKMIDLEEPEGGFIDEQVAAGNFGSPGEVVREGLALLRARQAKLEALRQALVEGEESGEAEPFEMDEWLAEQDRLDDAA